MDPELLLLAAANRQTVVPALSTLSTLNAISSLIDLPAPTLPTESVSFRLEDIHTLFIPLYIPVDIEAKYITVDIPRTTAMPSEVTPALWGRSINLGHGPVIRTESTLSASLPEGEHAFTLGHGPVSFPVPTPATVSSTAVRPFALGHGPVVFPTSRLPSNVRREYVESVVPTAASTLATVAKVIPTTELIHPSSVAENDDSLNAEVNRSVYRILGWSSQNWQWLKGMLGFEAPQLVNDDSDDDTRPIDLGCCGDRRRPGIDRYTNTEAENIVDIEHELGQIDGFADHHLLLPLHYNANPESPPAYTAIELPQACSEV